VKDIEGMLKKFGTSIHRRDIDYMIWEVDENADGKIDWDEFQLVYFRNVVDKTENEPTAFFHILEVKKQRDHISHIT
jgi:Ca2+-binding EF-hand superfamily protein